MTSNNRPSRADILARDFVDRIQGNLDKIKDKTIVAALNQADILSRHARAQASYSGAGSYYPSYGDSRSGGAQWPYGVGNRGRSRTLNHYRLLLNGRDAYHDSVQGRAIVTRKADNVAGTGLRLEPTPVASVLGITDEFADKWGRDVAHRFNLFMHDKKQCRSESMTGYQSQHFYIINKERDNDVFVRFYYSTDRGLQNPLQFEFIDPTQIRGSTITNTASPYYRFKDGIERDARGREKAYNIFVIDESGRVKSVTVQATGPKSKRKFMIHGYTPEYPGQARGYSPLGFAIQKFENITDLESSHIKKAINQSSILMTVENEDLDPGDPTMGVNGGVDAGPSEVVSEYGADAVPSTEAQNVDPYAMRMQGAEIKEPGSTVVIAPQRGDKLNMFAGMAPADSFHTFLDAFTAHLSAATGMPIEVLLMRFNQNYSASRATLILFWRKVVIDREEMAADYLDILYEMWLSGEIAAGRIQAPGWSDVVLRAAWLNASWVGMPLPDIDPSKTAKAAETRTALGHLTGKRGAREYNGSDFDTNAVTIEREYGERPPMPGQNAGGNNPDGNNAEAMATAIVDEIEMRKE
jgi:capsid protein